MVGDLCDAIDGLSGLLEASADAEQKRKRKRLLALALGLIGHGTAGARAAAASLPRTPARKLRRAVDVAAFQTITPRGALKDPAAIVPGDTLYISPVDQPAAGTVTKDPTRIPYARALAPLLAGSRAVIKVTLYEKLWLTDGKPCEVCEENAIAGWIPVDKPFPSGDWEPRAHPNCKCSLETRIAD
jgi:hypothetical protein